jgi:hypothetical protein
MNLIGHHFARISRTVIALGGHHDLFRGSRKFLLLCCLGLLIVAMADSMVLAQGSANQGPAELAEAPLSGADLETNPDIDAAIQSLDASLNSDDKSSEQQRTRDRLVGLGLMGGTLLALLGVVFGYLRLDHATRGFYCGRLQMLAGVSSALILAVSYFLWTQVLFK